MLIRFEKGGAFLGKSTTDTCCLNLPLLLEKWQEDRLYKRFEIVRQIYNTLVRAELKKWRQLVQSLEYIKNQEALLKLKDAKANDPKKKQLYSERDELLKMAGFREYSFKSDIQKYYKHFKDNIGSAVAIHGIAPQVWAAFAKKIKDNSIKVHFKKPGEVYSVRGYSRAGKSGGMEIIFCGTYIKWKGVKLPLKIFHPTAYETEMLSKRVKYVRILRKCGKNKDRWYAQLVLEGKPSVKRDLVTGERKHPIGIGSVGLDIGPQTLAYVSSTETNLVELADRVQNIENEKRLLQRKMDRSKRALNPNNYKDDGTIKTGVKLTRNKSKRYWKAQKELAYLQHKQAEIRKIQHITLANHLLSLGNCFYVENMDWRALAHRSKKTEIFEKTGRYKRKKRFGKSVANKAPATLIEILKQKCTSLEEKCPGVIKVPTSVRASQYNHLTKEYSKKSLSQRWNTMPDGSRIQRDLYSAFLLQHYDQEIKGFDQRRLEQDYPQFVCQHNQTILKLSAMSRTLSSMGIMRTIS